MDKLVWVDIETTGLRPDKDAILEIGIVITDLELENENFHNWVCRPSLDISIKDIDPYVFNMHSTSGLWQSSLAAEIDFHVAVGCAKRFLEEQNALGLPMTGSSIHFDRAFLKAQAPSLDKLFHYRNIDVSTMKNLVEIYHPDIFESRPQGEKKHRAVDDCFDSIAELKHYVNALGWELV